MKKEIDQDPNKRVTKVSKGGRVSFTYPEHFTNQQRGFTPAGSAILHFPKMRSFSHIRHL